jgi:predicted HAD superfamily Cof-like phosphohydrolase
MDATTRAEMFDALIDLIYIALGTIHLHGWNFNEGWRRVHDANMRKVLSSKENPGKYGAKIDVVKPANWIAPDLKDLA